MKTLIQLLSLLLITHIGYAQYRTVTHTAAVSTYGSTNVTVRGIGSAAVMGAGHCGAGPYHIGAGTSATSPRMGAYSFAFSPACHAIRVWVTMADSSTTRGPAESVSIEINGRRYPLSVRNYTPWTGGCSTSTMSIYGDSLVATATDQAGRLDILYCDIDSAKIITNGVNNGLVFSLQFSDTTVCSSIPDVVVCEDDTLRLRCPGDSTAASYTWSGPGGFSGSTASVLRAPMDVSMSGVYTVSKRVGSAVVSYTTNVTVVSAPPVPTDSSFISRICSQTTLRLFAVDTPGASFYWAGPTGFRSNSNRPAYPNIPTSATGNYSVWASYNGCPSQVRQFFVRVDSSPIQPTPVLLNRSLCEYDTMRLTASTATPGVRYTWVGPSMFTASTQNVSYPGVRTYYSGNYTVTVTDSFGRCSSSNVVNVNIYPKPTHPLLTTNAPVCVGNLLTLNAYVVPGTGRYYWSGPNSFSDSVASPSIFPVTLNARGTYTVYEVVDGCSSDTVTITVNINNTPSPPIITSSGLVCEGGRLTLTAIDTTAGALVAWAGPGSFRDSTFITVIDPVSAANAGIYTATAYLGPCSSSNVIGVNITVKPPLVINHHSRACTGDTLLLTASSSPGNSFLWVGPYSFRNTAPNPLRTPVSPEFEGIYTVTVTEPGGCFTTDYDTVKIYETPAPVWNHWINYCKDYVAPPLHPINADVSTLLWYPDARPGSVGSPIAPVPDTRVPGVYYFYLNQTLNGCKSVVDSIQVVVYPRPSVTMSQSGITACPKDVIEFHAFKDDSFATLHWLPWYYLNDTNAADVKAMPIANIQYSVVATNRWGCNDTAISREITVHPAATINLGVPDTIDLFTGESHHFLTGSNCQSFVWFPEAGLDNYTSSDPTANPNTSTTYYVTGTTEFGCTVTDSVYIRYNTENEYSVPNAFTPGRETNRYFKLIARGKATLQYFRVYNRWGVLMFETKDITEGWDGTLSGTPQPTGVYVYEVSASSNSTGKRFKVSGNVTLLR